MALNQDDEFDVSGKTIAVRLTQWDLLVLNAGFMPRLCALWAGLLALALGAGLLLSGGHSGASRVALVSVGAVALIAVVASMAGFLVAVGIVASSPVSNPLREDYTYTFQSEGLRARTAKRDMLIEWRRIRDVRRTRRFILIDVAPGLCHALPRRSFGSPREYQAFWRAARRLTRDALPAMSS